MQCLQCNFYLQHVLVKLKSVLELPFGLAFEIFSNYSIFPFSLNCLGLLTLLGFVSGWIFFFAGTMYLDFAGTMYLGATGDGRPLSVGKTS